MKDDDVPTTAELAAQYALRRAEREAAENPPHRSVDLRRHLALNSEQCAAVIGIGQRSVEKLRDEIGIPHVRLGGRVLYPVQALRRWLTERALAKTGAHDDTGGMTVELTAADVEVIRESIRYSKQRITDDPGKQPDLLKHERLKAIDAVLAKLRG